MKVRRRSLLLSAAGAAAGTAVTQSRIDALAATPKTIAGVIAKTEQNAITIRTFRSTLERITFSPGSTFSKDGPAQLGAFTIGDDVVAELRPGGPPWTASHLTMLYTITDARLEQVTSERVVTSAGALRIDKNTAVHPFGRIDIALALTALRPGDRVHIMHHPSPLTGDRVARAVFIA